MLIAVMTQEILLWHSQNSAVIHCKSALEVAALRLSIYYFPVLTREQFNKRELSSFHMIVSCDVVKCFF